MTEKPMTLLTQMFQDSPEGMTRDELLRRCDAFLGRKMDRAQFERTLDSLMGSKLIEEVDGVLKTTGGVTFG